MGSSTGAGPAPADVAITSFGYGHGAPPAGAHLTIDVRRHFRDPHVSPELRDLDATNARVYDAVLRTAGVRDLVLAMVHAIQAFRASSAGGPVLVAVGCAGGRHRAPAIAITLARCLKAAGTRTAVHHRDIGKPVIERAAGADAQDGPADAPRRDSRPSPAAAAAARIAGTQGDAVPRSRHSSEAVAS